MTKRKPKSEHKPTGRPTLYRPEYDEQVIELGRQGLSPAQMARHFDVARQTLYDWSKQNPTFSASFARALDLAEAYWEDKGHDNLDNRGFNSSVWMQTVKSRFRDTYGDRQAIEHTGKDGKDLFVDDSEQRQLARAILATIGPVIDHEPSDIQSVAQGAQAIEFIETDDDTQGNR